MTAYAVQVIVLILALLGAFFKSVKEDDQGKRVHSKLGLPIPTKPGLTVFVFLILSAGFSSYLIWQNKRDADDKNKVEKQVGERLKSQLTETQNALEKARLDNAVNLASAQKRILDDMQLKQKSNLENFSSVLHLQREAERQAIDGFRKALNPLPTQNLELTLQFLSPHGLIKFSPLANANSQPS